MAEWTIATVLKTVEPKGSVGSNPTPSALARFLAKCRKAEIAGGLCR
jgi:hypothetical protein